MARLTIKNLFGLLNPRSTTSKETLAVDPDSKQLPLRGGRKSVPEQADEYNIIAGLQGSEVQNEISPRVYDVLDTLAKTNPDFSHAVENIVQLANRPFKITFDDSLTDTQEEELKAIIETNSQFWYDNAGGLTSLRNDLFAQIAVNGCLSCEIVPRDDLSGISEIVLVAPKSIKFVYDKEGGRYYPYQDTTKLSSGYVLNSSAGLIELNPVTYQYYAIRRFSESPYATPPFLSALQSIAQEHQMLESLNSVIDRYGMLGFLTIAVSAPKPFPSESQEAYQQRTENYLAELVPEVEKGMDRGFVLGFKGEHEFELAANNMNTQGAKDLIEIITLLKLSGLKQDPLMFGRNFSTTETVGRVVMAKMTAMLRNYQALVDQLTAYAIQIEAQLLGYPVGYVKVESEKPIVSDEIKDQQAYQLEIQNTITLRNEGIIDQVQAANLLGYDSPAEDATLVPVVEEGIVEEDEDPTQETDTDSNRAEFNYSHIHGTFQEQLASYRNTKFGKLIAKYINDYFEATNANYDHAVESMVVRIGNKLLDMVEYASEDQVLDAVFAEFSTQWNTEFSSHQRGITEKWVNEAYKAFRKDKSVLQGLDTVPDLIFNTLDYRAMDFYAQSDDFYLGKFINDASTRKKMTQYIKDNYLAGDLPIGRNSQALDPFKQEFGTLLKGEDWKIERIISTTVNKMRNTAAINSMTDASVMTYEIRGVNDQLQCDWCASMQGRQFSVDKERDRLSQAVNGDPKNAAVSPFLTAIYKKEKGESSTDFRNRLKSTPSSEIENQGVAPPPYHPFCRDVVVAVLP